MKHSSATLRYWRLITFPEQFEFRDAQMRELAFQIRPGLRGGRPLNTICKGLPGTGKTTSIRKLFAEIEETTKKLVRYI